MQNFRHIFSGSIYIFCLLILLSYNALAQEFNISNKESIENLIEEIASDSDQDLDYNTLFDDINYFAKNPLNINATSRVELEKLHFINDLQITNILNYIKSYGNILSIYELKMIDGFNIDDIQRLLPFISIKNVNKKNKFILKDALKYSKHELFLRSQFILDKQSGFLSATDSMLDAKPNSRYLGNRYKYYSRYQFKLKNKIIAGITTEKDAGEEFLKGTQRKGFDYYTAYIQLNDFGFIKTFVAGDFQMQFGQGLILWSGLAGGKSSYVLNTRKKARGLKKYSSTNENTFMRGCGTTLSYKNFDLSLFYSRKKIDANITNIDSLSGNITEISSRQNTGLHGTLNQIDDKDAIGETVYGTNLAFRKKNFKLGITHVNYQLDANLIKNITPQNKFDFQGLGNYNTSFDYLITSHKTVFFGEIAIGKNFSIATINGLLINPVPRVSLAITQRYYQKNYQAYYGKAFGESSSTNNESGIYIGAEIRPVAYWKISAYFDVFKFPWLSYQTDAPSNGSEYFVNIDYSPKRNLSMYCRYKRQIKPKTFFTEAPTIEDIENVDHQTFRYHIAYKLSENLSISNRIEYVIYKDKEISNGILLYQDFNYSFSKFPISISARFALFDTDSYTSRIYAYEKDILYAYSVPALQNKGIRSYLTLRSKISKNISLWLRYASTVYSNKNTIGSGLDEIEGNKKREIKLQLRIKI